MHRKEEKEKKIQVLLNQLYLNFCPQGAIYHYSVRFKPHLPHRYSMHVMDKLSKLDWPSVSDQVQMAYEGSRSIFSTERLFWRQRYTVSVDIHFPDVPERTVELELQSRKKLTNNRISDWMVNEDRWGYEVTLKAVESIVMKSLEGQFVRLNNMVFPEWGEGIVKGEMSLRTGISHVVSWEKESTFRLTLDAQLRAFYEKGSLVKTMAMVLGHEGVESLRKLREDEVHMLSEGFRGVQVEVQLRGTKHDMGIHTIRNIVSWDQDEPVDTVLDDVSDVW